MNRARLLLIGFVALALGAFVSLTVYRNLKAQGGARAPLGVPVVVATTDIPIGAKIEEKDVRLVHFQAGDIPPNVIHDVSRVVGRGAVLPMSRGEFVLPNKLAGENAGSGLPALIPPGMRAISVRVNEVVGVAGFVQPGTRVDVLVTGTPAGGGQQQTTTVLKNVAVIAAGQRLERSSSGESQVAPVITLLVSPDDAQKLTLASMDGRIQLALRNPLDTKQDDLAAVSAGSLYKNSAPVTPVAPSRPARPKHVTTVEAPPAPAVYTIETIRGDKRDVTKF